MKDKIIGGNWKLNKTIAETEEFMKEFIPLFKRSSSEYKVVIFPTFTSLQRAVEMSYGTGLLIGAQNLFYEEQGAYTGEVSAAMLKEIGVEFVLVGHSERRHIFGENDEIISRKVRAGLDHGLKTVLCVGEMLSDREQGKAFSVVAKQLETGLSSVNEQELNNMVIAYEPVWAIGTGKTATPQIAEEMHAFIRKTLHQIFGTSDISLIYGGSIKPNNIRELSEQPDIDGGLVGGASLNVESFIKIIENAI